MSDQISRLLAGDISLFLDALPGHIYCIDNQNRLMACNKKQAQAFGFESPSHIKGRTLQELDNNQEISKAIIKNNRTVIWTLDKS